MKSSNNRYRLQNRPLRGCFFLIILLLLSACSGTKFIPKNDSFYTGAVIDIRSNQNVGNKKNIKRRLEQYITPTPNTVIFGSRPGVWFYSIAGKKEKGIGGWIKKTLGQKPVLLSDAVPDRTAKLLQGQLNNHGYFKSVVTYRVKTKHQKSVVVYVAEVQPPYRLQNINYPRGRDSTYAIIMRNLREKSLLKKGQRYNLERLQAEKIRIQENVHNEGFYYFNQHDIIFEADSTVGKKKVDIDLKTVPNVPEKAKRIYHIGNVNVITNYSLRLDSIKNYADTVYIDGYRYVGDGNNRFKPGVILGVINLKQGDIYTQNARDLTMSHLTGLGTFKFVNIKFKDSPKDSSTVDATVYLTPFLKKSIRVEVQGVSKSNNFVGPGIGVTFTNRNFLRGAELFQLKVNTGYESQISRQQSGALNSFELGLEASLAIHRFITPIRVNYSSKRYLPQTLFKVGYNVQQRVGYFRLNSITGSFGYTWRESTSKTHTLYPIDISYVEVTDRSHKFDSIVGQNPFLQRAFENQFIPAMRYSFTLNTQLKEATTDKYTESKSNPNSFYFNGNLELSGNVLHAFQENLFKSEDTVRTLFGSPYSQYIKTDVDFRYYVGIGRHNKLAARLIAGLGYPFGNSNTLPYIKQFAIGGSNSIRAFPARSIGPGAYNVRSDTSIHVNTLFIDQRGDIKLEGSAEYRFDIYKVLKGAMFVDAGNIWLLNDDPKRPGGKFKSDTFLDQIVVGTGAGLRFDFNFFVLRFDLGFPLRKAVPLFDQETGEPLNRNNIEWVTDKIDFGSSPWRAQNLLLNIAIGYPF